MECITTYLFCSVISIGTVAYFWLHRAPVRGAIENIDVGCEKEQPVPDLSSMGPFDCVVSNAPLILIPSKKTNCSRRIKTPIVFKQEWEKERKREREQEREKGGKNENIYSAS